MHIPKWNSFRTVWTATEKHIENWIKISYTFVWERERESSLVGPDQGAPSMDEGYWFLFNVRFYQKFKHYSLPWLIQSKFWDKQLKIYRVILTNRRDMKLLHWPWFCKITRDILQCYIDLDFVKFILGVAICLTNNWRGRGKYYFFI